MNHGNYVEKLASNYAYKIKFPEEDSGDDVVWPDDVMETLLIDAAVKVSSGDKAAIRKAIDDEVQRCIATFGMKE